MTSAADIGVRVPADAEPGVAPEPLTRLGRAWRIAACLLVSLVVLTMTIVGAESSGYSGSSRFVLAVVGDLFVVTPVLYVGLWWHRRFPLWLSVAVILLSGVSTMALGPSLLLLVSVATRRRWRSTLVVALATVVASMLYERVYPSDGMPWWGALIFAGIVTAAVTVWGMYTGARRELVGQWRWRAENAEVEQARQVAAAAQAERARIAREMHDVLAHRLSQVSLHAGVLSYRHDLSPEAVRAEAETIRAASTAALDDLRSILGVLRNDDRGAVAAPQPTAADLPALVAEASATSPVELADSTTAPLPATLGRHVYRMTQEALTNARRHAPGAAVAVRLTGSPGGEVHLRVTNPPGGQPVGGGAGLGLVGLRERATILGGRVVAQPAADGGWEVDARLPWPLTEEDS